ncbi:hypothetical protein FRC02_003637 [Tulasnella sp. 418]|nr:hypothetical protein FRC02_003637 [Tulasnella sp. 418]
MFSPFSALVIASFVAAVASKKGGGGSSEGGGSGGYYYSFEEGSSGEGSSGGYYYGSEEGSSGGYDSHDVGVGIASSIECFAEGNGCGGMIIGIVIGVVVLFIIGVVFALRVKGNTKATAKNAQTENGITDPETPVMTTTPSIQEPANATTPATPRTPPPAYTTFPTQTGWHQSISMDSLTPLAFIPPQPVVPLPPSNDTRSQNVIII